MATGAMTSTYIRILQVSYDDDWLAEGSTTRETENLNWSTIILGHCSLQSQHFALIYTKLERSKAESVNHPMSQLLEGKFKNGIQYFYLEEYFGINIKQVLVSSPKTVFSLSDKCLLDSSAMLIYNCHNPQQCGYCSCFILLDLSFFSSYLIFI